MSLWRDWLPSSVSEAARIQEPQQFSALSHALETELNKKARDEAAFGASTRWIPAINMYLNSKVSTGTGNGSRSVSAVV